MKIRLFFFSIVVIIISPSAWAQVTNADKLFEMAQQEQSDGRYADAISFYSEHLAQRPAHDEAYIGRAASKEQLKDFKGALIDYSIVIELAPESYDARLGRANVFYKLGRFEEAKQDYLQLLSIPKGETNTVYFNKSASVAGSMQITTAQSDIDPTIFNYIGLSELKLGNFKAAKSWIDSAINRRPDVADYYVNRGLVRQSLGDKNASEDFEHALRLNADHTAALTSIALERKSDRDSSAKYLRQAIESDPDVVTPYLERAYQRMQDGSYLQALEDYDAAIKLEDKDPEIWLNRGYVKEKLNDLEGAHRDYSKAIALKEDFAKAWLNRGNLLQKQGKFNEALEDYSVAITYEPDYGAAFYNRAIARHRLNQKQESCDDILKAESLGVAVNAKLKEEVCQ